MGLVKDKNVFVRDGDKEREIRGEGKLKEVMNGIGDWV